MPDSRFPHRAHIATPWVVAFLGLLVASGGALACDGHSYAFNIAAGATVTGGGLTIRLDKVKFVDDTPDKYYISVKDDGTILADHMLLAQYDTVNLPTKCGTVSIGANRKSLFGDGLLAINWSYF